MKVELCADFQRYDDVMIDLDQNATMPLRPEALRAMLPWLSGPVGNPASAHGTGRQARRALEDARDLLASLLGAFPEEVVFTSGATEANNLALFGLAGDAPGVIHASPIEHPGVIEPLRQLAGLGFTIEWLSVNAEGIVRDRSMSELSAARLVTVMLANHETGAIQPIAELAASRPSAVFHCDAAQAVGKIPVDFRALGVTSLSASGHKFGGPVGVGVLLLKRGTKLRPMMFGGHQQQGRRPGTESVVLAVGFAAALEAAVRELPAATAQLTALRQRFLARLAEAAPVTLNGPTNGGLPQVLNLSFPGCRADALLMALDLAGVACSTGSACSSGSLLPSPVLKAMGVPEERLHSAMRFSFGSDISEAEIDAAAGQIVTVVARLRNAQEDEQS
jgi:cysteine desulfurase